MAERVIKIRHSRRLKLLPQRQHRRLGRCQHRIKPPYHHHRQNDLAIIPHLIDVYETVISDAPNKRDKTIVYLLIHKCPPPFMLIFNEFYILVVIPAIDTPLPSGKHENNPLISG